MSLVIGCGVWFISFWCSQVYCRKSGEVLRGKLASARGDHGLRGCHGWGGREEQGGNEGIAIVSAALLSSRAMKFSELVRLLEQEGFRLVKEKGSIRYYAKAGHPRLIRVDFHGAKEVPTGTCHAILKAAGVKRK